MTLVVWTFALVGAVIHIVAFVWETLLFQRPGVHQGVFSIVGARAGKGIGGALAQGLPALVALIAAVL